MAGSSLLGMEGTKRRGEDCSLQPNGHDTKKLHLSPSAAAADQTVEDYLQAYCRQLVEDVNRHTEKLLKIFEEEVRKGKAEVLALARGEDEARHLCRVTLLGTEGNYKDNQFILLQTEDKHEFLMGRSTGKRFKEGGVSLSVDPEVSTTHAKMFCRDGKVFIEDLGSLNGTHLNGSALEANAPALVTSGDLIRIGSSVFEVTVSRQDGDDHGPLCDLPDSASGANESSAPLMATVRE